MGKVERHPTSYPILPRREKKLPRKRKVAAAVGSQYYTNSDIKYWVIDRVTQYLTGSAPTIVNNSLYQKTAGMSASKTYSNNGEWRRKIAQKLDAGSNYTRTGGYAVGTLLKGWSQASVSHGSTRWYCEKAWLGDPMIESSEDTALKDVALARLKNRLNGHVGGMSLLPPLAEAREIHGLVRQINGVAGETFKALLSAKRSHGKSVVRQAGDAWLMFGFGVNPLLSDVAKLANSIEDYKSRQDHTAYVHGTASKEWFTSRMLVSGLDLGTGYVVYDIHGRAVHQLSYRYKGAVDLKVRSSASYGVDDHLGLKLGQLPSALWELTAYSWAVDYFTTVGAWLDDVFYTLPGNLRYLALNKRYQNKVEMSTKVRTLFPGYTWREVGADPGETEYYLFTRTMLSSLPTRQLRVKSVDEVAKHGLTKVLNLAAVLAGRTIR